MARRKKNDRVETLVGQLIQNELETHLSRMVKKAKKRAVRESAKLKEYLQLPYVKESDVIEAEVIGEQPGADENNSDIKKIHSENLESHLGREAMELTAIYTKDSKRYHGFQLNEDQGVIGSLYFTRDGEKIPDQVVIILKTPGGDRETQ